MSESSVNTVRGTGAEKCPLHVLVIDEDSSICDMFSDIFATENYVVDRCTSADRLYSIDFSDYNLVFVDLGIEGNDGGFSIVEQIKQIYPDNRIAVIAYSVRMSPDTIIRALYSGADDYLIKPFSIRELKARVRSVMRRH